MDCCVNFIDIDVHIYTQNYKFISGKYMTTNETRWKQFVEEVASEGLVWTIEKNGE